VDFFDIYQLATFERKIRRRIFEPVYEKWPMTETGNEGVRNC